jgi:hypothetical protein
MAYTISTSSNFHWIERVEAVSNTAGCLKLVLHGADFLPDNANTAEVLIFSDDHAMVERLVAAINGAKEPANG